MHLPVFLHYVGSSTSGLFSTFAERYYHNNDTAQCEVASLLIPLRSGLTCSGVKGREVLCEYGSGGSELESKSSHSCSVFICCFDHSEVGILYPKGEGHNWPEDGEETNHVNEI